MIGAAGASDIFAAAVRSRMLEVQQIGFFAWFSGAGGGGTPVVGPEAVG
jgi:hypothetical protein